MWTIMYCCNRNLCKTRLVDCQIPKLVYQFQMRIPTQSAPFQLALSQKRETWWKKSHQAKKTLTMEMGKLEEAMTDSHILRVDNMAAK
jgi:hypothetical protein